jgi:hypothetical protein
MKRWRARGEPSFKPGKRMMCELCDKPFIQHAPTQMRCSRGCNKKSWYAKSPENRAKAAASETKRRLATRIETFTAYGGKCSCCGESHQEFLTIDHINGGGTKHRREIGAGEGVRFYRWLKQQGFPQNDYQCLCMNCNHAIGLQGYCPHDRE